MVDWGGKTLDCILKIGKRLVNPMEKTTYFPSNRDQQSTFIQVIYNVLRNLVTSKKQRYI